MSFIVNRDFYAKASTVVVLSQICKDVLLKNIPECNVHSIGCSLWSEEALDKIEELSENRKYGFCIMKSDNPTKNFLKTVEFCKEKKIDPIHLRSDSHHKFLEMMSKYRTLVFLPTVLETYSRLCAEAKMLGLSLLTNRVNIGFFSEDYSDLKGKPLIETIRQKQQEAYKFFEGCL